MSKTIQTIISNINRKELTNNTQRVGLQLLATGDWVSRGSFRTPSATRRVRDLRLERHGGFEVECKSSVELNRPTNTYYYRINTSKVTKKQVETLFKQSI